MAILRSKGLIREPNRHPIGGVHHSALIGAPGPLPESIDWSVGWTNQTNRSSCTGHAFKKLVEGTAKAGGYAGSGHASADGIYALRVEDYPNLPLEAPLPDEGAQPSTIASGLSRFGTLEEADGPIDVTSRLTVDQLVRAQRFRVTQIALVDLAGSALVLAVKQALAAGLIPVFAMEVDEAYEQLGFNDVYDGPKGPSLGGHMQAVDAYHSGLIGVPGSWGGGWANAGRAWITERGFGALATNVYVAKIVPVLT